jgi:2-(1,2-epoxy-1,2-dihydrophenyl)acetyl-CoA isomerase
MAKPKCKNSIQRGANLAENSKLLVEMQDGVKRITFNRPERRNAVDAQTQSLFQKAIFESAEDGSRVIVLTGAGEAFCAGADLQSMSAIEIKDTDVTATLRTGTNATVLAMRKLSIPIIARIHGHAVGVGCSYALACDVLIASEQAKFGQGFVKIGLMPDGGPTYFLPRSIGYARAFELVATGDIISAEQALSLGMINKVVPVQLLDEAVNQLAARLAEAAPIALAKIKQGLNFGLGTDLAGALEFEAVNQDACFHSADFVEGVTAFLQKRKSAFKGK